MTAAASGSFIHSPLGNRERFRRKEQKGESGGGEQCGSITAEQFEAKGIDRVIAACFLSSKESFFDAFRR